MKWVGNAARVGKFVVGNLKGRDHLGELGVDGRLTLKWILKEEGLKMWTGFISLRLGTSGALVFKVTKLRFP
jgi:hypothetical protein